MATGGMSGGRLVVRWGGCLLVGVWMWIHGQEPRFWRPRRCRALRERARGSFFATNCLPAFSDDMRWRRSPYCRAERGERLFFGSRSRLRQYGERRHRISSENAGKQFVAKNDPRARTSRRRRHRRGRRKHHCCHHRSPHAYEGNRPAERPTGGRHPARGHAFHAIGAQAPPMAFRIGAPMLRL